MAIRVLLPAEEEQLVEEVFDPEQRADTLAEWILVQDLVVDRHGRGCAVAFDDITRHCE
jgi:hypothetical protein